MEKEVEFWKPITEFEGLYEISNFGKIKSLSKIKFLKGKYPFATKEKILKPVANSKGYLLIVLYKDGQKFNHSVHQLMGINFLNHKLGNLKIVINHKDFNRQNNYVDNLEVTTQRENTNKKHLKSKSEYIGVHYDKKWKKWVSRIFINKNRIILGGFKTELEAHNAYQNKLKSIL